MKALGRVDLSLKLNFMPMCGIPASCGDFDVSLKNAIDDTSQHTNYIIYCTRLSPSPTRWLMGHCSRSFDVCNGMSSCSEPRAHRHASDHPAAQREGQARVDGSLSTVRPPDDFLL